jgi:uncharacterized protein YecT (DUF1311 family)
MSSWIASEPLVIWRRRYNSGMCRLHPVGLLLIALAPHALRAQDASSYQRRAAAALQFEIAQIGKDCGNPKNTLDINNCLMTVAEKTQSNYRTFYASLRTLLKAGSEAALQLEKSQAQWEMYSTSACDAVDTFYRSGTIRVAAVTGCNIQLTRSRMQDLNVLYETVLHL